MIFKVDVDHKVRDVNDTIEAVPEFKDCNDKALRYVFLMYDYDSPYSRMPMELRKDQVLVSIGYTNKKTIDTFFYRYGDAIEKATAVFKKMQYNSEFEALISMKIRIEAWNKLLRRADEDLTDKEQTLAQKIFDKMPSYMKRVKELEEIVGYRDIIEDDEEGLQRTTLEHYMESTIEEQQK